MLRGPIEIKSFVIPKEFFSDIGKVYRFSPDNKPKGGPSVKERPPFGSLEVVNYFFRRAF